MTEREYPRWVHRHGNGDKHSRVAEDAGEEEAILARWRTEDEAAEAKHAALAQPAIEPVPVQRQVNALMGASPPAIPPTHRGGWPKGKPRTKQPAVN